MKFENYTPGNGYSYQLALTDIENDTGDQLLVWLNPSYQSSGVAVNIGAVKWVNSDVLEKLLDYPVEKHLVVIQAWLKTKGVGGHKI